MYAIRRSDGLFLCDGAVYVKSGRTLPQPIWQEIDGTRETYIEESLWNITMRKERLEKIYTDHKIEVFRLTEEQCEYLTFRRLRGN